MMKKPGLVIAPLLLALLWAGVASGIDVELKIERARGGVNPQYPATLKMLNKTLSPPVGDWNFPRWKGEFPIFALVTLAGEEKLLVVDFKDGREPFYNRLYFDANGNRDLTDDPVIEADGSTDPLAYKAGFALKGVPVMKAGKAADYDFHLYMSFQGRIRSKLKKSTVERSVQLILIPDCRLEGSFAWKDRQYDICLYDGNGNGVFDDTPTVPEISAITAGTAINLLGDYCRIALAGSKVDAAAFTLYGEFLVLEGETFRLKIGAGFERLTLEPVASGLAALELSMAPERMCLFREDGSHCVMIYRPGGLVNIPSGKYRLYNYQAGRKDDQGDEWALSATATPETGAVTLEESGKARLEFGEPFTAAASVPAWSLDAIKNGYADQVSVEFSIVGAAKEKVTDLKRVSGNKTLIPMSKAEKTRPKEPAFKVLSEGGEVVLDGQFKYG